jgi:RNA polymerase sigma-70 factor (ECF subfamily)
MSNDDQELLIGIRNGDALSWERLISRYEGRLQAFARSRLRDSAASEDIVQDTFLGFLISLPNYDSTTPLESFLFSIAAHKLADALRRSGRRPTLTLAFGRSSQTTNEPAGRSRKASSMARSREGRDQEQKVIAECLKELIQIWFSRGEFERLSCVELLFVLGWSNKAVAEKLAISEQAVANHKSHVVAKLKSAAVTKLREVDWQALKVE